MLQFSPTSTSYSVQSLYALYIYVLREITCSSTAACRDSYTPNYIDSMYRSGSHSSLASWCSTVCMTKHPATSSTSASLSPVSPLDNIFTMPAEVFSSCLAIVSELMDGGLFLWPALRYGTGYQTVWEIQPLAETPSSVH